MAVYAIGDLQGCYDPLRRLLDTISFDPANDRLWLTGDLVNRGPKSLKTLRFVKSLDTSVVSVLGNHDLHLIALATGVVSYSQRFASLKKLLRWEHCDELVDWLRHRPLAHFDAALNSLLVHAGVHPQWSLTQTLALADEVVTSLRGDDYRTLLKKMYGNTPLHWSDDLSGYKRSRFIVNCLTRMRMLTPKQGLNFTFSREPWPARQKLKAWFDFENPAWKGTRIIFGHWSALGLLALPGLLSIDTGCVWGRPLTAARIDTSAPQIYQVTGQ